MNGADPKDSDLSAACDGQVGPYRLLRVLAKSTHTRIYDVEHTSIGRRAAMKILSPEHLAKPGILSRMVEGAQALNRIGHPNIVEIIDIVEVTADGGGLAVVMELLEGRSLASLLTGPPSARPDADRYVPIMAQVAGALAAAHQASFVHRNMKPDNVFLVERGRAREYVKLLGFGIAKSLDEAPSERSSDRYATVEGTFIGTPAYASPEQAVGRGVDHRTDVYSFGVILFELVHGRLPFAGSTIGEYLYQHLSAPVPAAPAHVLADPVLRTLDDLARRCLAKARAERPDMTDVGQILDGLARGNPEVVTPPPPERRAARNVIVAAALVCAACAAGLGAMSLARHVLARGHTPCAGPSCIEAPAKPQR